MDFDAVYDEGFEFVWRTLRRFGVDEAHAEDLTQEVFVIVHRRLSSFEGRSAVNTWLYGIAKNVARDHRRKAHTRAQHVELEERASRTSDSPERVAQRREAASLVTELLASLEERKREAFVLADMEGMTAPEIAEATGAKLPTVYTRIRAGREAFKAALERHQARERKA